MAPQTFTVALLQLEPAPDPDTSLRIGLEACATATSMGADLALFPEMWNVGYRFPSEALSAEEWNGWAIAETDAYYQAFTRSARDNGIAIALTYLRRNSGGDPYNALSIIDRHGETRLTYAKVHTCDFSQEAVVAPGREFSVCDLDTRSGNIAIGAMICYDREFPESARILMVKGAEVLLIPNACDVDINRKCQLRTRAFENMVGCAMANYAGEPYGGRSVAFDGIAYEGGDAEQDGRARDMEIVQAGSEATIVSARFDIDALREYRKQEAWGNAYRKPSAYNALVDATVHEPFCRDDARGR